MIDDFFSRIGGNRTFENPEISPNIDSASLPQTVPGGGIGEIKDSIEAFSPISSFMDVPSQPATGQCNWDSILQIKEELSKDNPDWQQIFQTFANLSPADQPATFAEMAKDGDLAEGSPFLSFVQNLPPEAHDAFAKFLQPLIAAQTHAKTSGTDSMWLNYGLSMTFSDMRQQGGKFADVVRQMWHTGMPEFNTDQGEDLIEILQQDPAPEHKLFDLSIMNVLAQNNPGAADVTQINQEMSSYVDNFVNGTQTIPPPGLSEWFQNCPVDAMAKLSDITEHNKMGDFVNQVLQSGDNIGKSLAQALCNYYPTGHYSYVFQQFFTALQAQKGNPMADDIARDMVNTINGAQNSLVTGLNSLSPGILIDLKLILESGDEPDLDAQALGLVNDAYNSATGHATPEPSITSAPAESTTIGSTDSTSADSTTIASTDSQTLAGQLENYLSQYASNPLAQTLVSSFSSTILDALQQAPSETQINVLKELEQTGTSPNTAFDQLVKLLSDNGQRTDSMADYLLLLVDDAKSDPSAGELLSHAYSDLESFTSDPSKLRALIENFVNQLSQQDLSLIPSDTLQAMQSDLTANSGDSAVAEKLQEAINPSN